jgi:hypothetical protein
MTVTLPPTQASALAHENVRSVALKPVLMRLMTALCAVVGLSAMAAEEAVGNGLTFENGAYLYGESPVADTIGSVYFVFQVEAGHLVGAVYQPASSFDCVYGQVGNERLHLTLIDAYDQAERPYTVALTQSETTLASTQSMVQAPSLEGMHPIRTLSELDRQLLATCQR